MTTNQLDEYPADFFCDYFVGLLIKICTFAAHLDGHLFANPLHLDGVYNNKTNSLG